MPNVYESDAHRPRWQRVWLWLLESPSGQPILGIPLGLLALAPIIWFGVWWVVVIAVAGLAFALGWNAARRKMIRDGWVDKL